MNLDRADPCRINRLVILALAWTLGFAVCAEIALGVGSWYRAAADGNGTNAVHDVLKTIITFVLGVFSGIVQARIVGAGNHGGPDAAPEAPAPTPQAGPIIPPSQG